MPGTWASIQLAPASRISIERRTMSDPLEHSAVSAQRLAVGLTAPLEPLARGHVEGVATDAGDLVAAAFGDRHHGREPAHAATVTHLIFDLAALAGADHARTQLGERLVVVLRARARPRPRRVPARRSRS